MKFEIVLLVLSFYVVYGQTPCKSPSQWEGLLYETDDAHGFRGIGNFSYDGLNKRTRFLESVTDINFKDTFDVLRLWNQKIEYRFDVNRKICTKNALALPWVIF